jgi:alpha-tubulin suppressor-like RCC1 family protein
MTALSVSSGSHHSALVNQNGEVFVCGSQLHGKLGIPNVSVMNLLKWQQVSLKAKARKVCCGDYHTLCLMADGSVYSWGGSLHKVSTLVSFKVF